MPHYRFPEIQPQTAPTLLLLRAEEDGPQGRMREGTAGFRNTICAMVSRAVFHRTIIALFIFYSATCVLAQAADFSADQVEYNKHQPKTIVTSRVYVSTSGVRVENNPGQAEEVVWITNNRAQKVWVMRPTKRIYTETAFKEGGRKAQPGVDGKDHEVEVSTLMDATACDGFDKSRQFGMETVMDRKTVKWACGDSQTQTTIMQWYDADLKMVIREQDESGQISELRNIKLAAQPATLFQVTPGYRKASMQELFPAAR